MIWHGTNLKIGDLLMYEISDISTFYCPKAKEYLAAEKRYLNLPTNWQKKKDIKIIRCGL